MRGMLKRACCLTVLMFVAALLCLHGSGCAKVRSGKWGSNMKWYYDTKTKTVTIEGLGTMENNFGDEDPESDIAFTWHEKAKKIILKPGINHIGAKTFHNFEKLEEVVLPEGLISIGPDAFSRLYKLKKIEFPSTIRKIGDRAFDCTSVSEVSLPHVERIGREAFSATNLKHLTISKSCRTINSNTFSFCRTLKSVEIENGIKTISKGMFFRSGLRSVTIPESVTEIQNHAFYSFSPEEGELRNVTIKSTQIETWGKDIFGKARKNLVIRVPKSKKREYKKALRKGGLPDYVKVVGE